MPRAAKRHDHTGQRRGEPGPEIMAFQRAQRGIHWWLGDAFHRGSNGVVE
jgi:hypothetical protein